MSTENRRYLPHETMSRYHAVKAYRDTKDVSYVCRRYHISKASLMRWNKRYDGTKESLVSRSHRPVFPHPNAHTPQELKWIQDYHRRNPDISICELYGKLREDKGYSRSPGSLYRVFVRLGYRKKTPSTKRREKHTQKYETPTMPGIKCQMDVKYVPTLCYVGADGQKFYQYTMIDEATRERFIYAYQEQSSYSTVDFVLRAVSYFGYVPQIIQTDNSSEFIHWKKTERVHLLGVLCQKLGVTHKLIRPRTPWHNGKVERSHRNDQERFYNHLNFYNCEDLQTQMWAYLRRSNDIPMQVLGWLSPKQKRKQLGALS